MQTQRDRQGWLDGHRRACQAQPGRHFARQPCQGSQRLPRAQPGRQTERQREAHTQTERPCIPGGQAVLQKKGLRVSHFGLPVSHFQGPCSQADAGIGLSASAAQAPWRSRAGRQQECGGQADIATRETCRDAGRQRKMQPALAAASFPACPGSHRGERARQLASRAKKTRQARQPHACACTGTCNQAPQTATCMCVHA